MVCVVHLQLGLPIGSAYAIIGLGKPGLVAEGISWLWLPALTVNTVGLAINGWQWQAQTNVNRAGSAGSQ